jgi:hypothetical protein
LVSGSGYAAAMAYGYSPTAPVATVAQPVTATFDSSGQLTSLSGSAGTWTLVSGSSADFGSDGILAWGRWVGTADLPEASNVVYDANKGFHYVVGIPTPTMPTVGTARYTLAGATSPTYLDGRVTPGTLTGNLTVNFATPAVGVSLTASMQDGVTYSIGGSAAISGSTFSGSTLSNLTTSGSGCFSSCSASVQGFFAGTSAERAGLAYHISDGSGSDVVGAAAFAKQ